MHMAKNDFNKYKTFNNYATNFRVFTVNLNLKTN